MRRHRLSATEKEDIVNEYVNKLTPMIVLAEKHNITRQGIYKFLRHHNIDTKKKQIPVSCSTCDKPVFRHKARIRRQRNHFCSSECYFAFLEAGNGYPYIQNRYGQRIARSVASQYFNLQDGNIVHHEDRNCHNNTLRNLRIFATQGDHIRHHRGFQVTPLWDGRQVDTIIIRK